MWLNVAAAIVKIQKIRVPHLPFGRNYKANMYPKLMIKMYIGLRNPQIGQIARIRNTKRANEEMDITGISLGIFSMSASYPFKGMIRVTYSMMDMFMPRHIKVRFINTGLMSSFSHNCLKKFVL